MLSNATLVVSPSASTRVGVKLDLGLREKITSLSGPLTTLEELFSADS